MLESVMKTISLTDGSKAIVDDNMFDFLSQFKWSNCSGYPTTSIRFNELNGMQNREPITMHRMIIGCAWPRNLVIDHINRNTLDNRRCNLRVVTVSFNLLNSSNRIAKRETIAYLRMNFCTRLKKAAPVRIGPPIRAKRIYIEKQKYAYVLKLRMNAKTTYLASYKTKEEACIASEIVLQYLHKSS